MIEKVNPKHPDKVADRIAGALVDLAYLKQDNPKIAVEALIGHGHCTIIAETSTELNISEVESIVNRIAGDIKVHYIESPQDTHLSKNQSGKIKTGDNGIFRGVPVDDEVRECSELARELYNTYKSDGKYILDKENRRVIICQSNAKDIVIKGDYDKIINPLGYWTGGVDVDSGATNRKLGSDMGRAVTGGGLHGKDLSKADVSVNIYAHLKAQEQNKDVSVCCAIGDDKVDGLEYAEIVELSRQYINKIGGFEKFAEWGLV